MPSPEFQQLAKDFVAHCREGQEREGLKIFYAEDAVSVEAMAPPGEDREKHGLAAIEGKHDWWESAMEVIEGSVEGPFFNAPDVFAVYFTLKAKEKASGNVMDMQEVGLYHVKDGKIVREEFFYGLEPM
ncbi:MAG: nuclear transport factor 2 family protein [Pseudomonadota bacterium]